MIKYVSFAWQHKGKYAIICKFNWLKTKVNEGSWKISYPVTPSSGLQLSSREGSANASLWEIFDFDHYLYENCKSHQLEKI